MSRNNVNFETVLEKLARIMARKYNLEVIIEGNSAYTDGKKIVLPMLEDIKEEMKADLFGMLDHEVAHCKFTDFEAMRNLINRFHKELFNAIEDSRIELELPKEYPGTEQNLRRLNQKWTAKLDETRPKMPWPIRVILCLREIYDNKAPQVDEQIEPIIAAVLEDAKELRKATNSAEIVSATEEIIRKINLAREELAKGLPPYEEEDMAELEAMRGETGIALDPDRKEKGKARQAQGAEQFDPAVEKKKSEEAGGEEGEDSEGEFADGKEASDEKASMSAERKGTEKGKGTSKKADKEGEDEDEIESSTGNTDEDEDFDSDENSESESESDSELDEDETEATSGKSSEKGEGNLEKEKTSNKKDSEDADEESVESNSDVHNHEVDELIEERDYTNWSDSAEEQKMLEDGIDEADSEFNKHEFSTESYMDRQLEKAVAKEPKVQSDRGMYSSHSEKIDPKHVSVPYTRQYDEVHDFTGRGDRTEYAERKRMIMKHVNPIKQHMERVLKVKENRRFSFEKERGLLNTRSLSSLCINKGYRTPFKQFSKTDTTNVAVSLVIDCSGSMRGNKIEVARQTGLAFGESLKALGISFEMVGFNTDTSHEMYNDTRALTAADTARFNRFGEKLIHMVFKSFESNDLSGICKAESGGANADGESITWAAKRLALRKEKRKIMFVLSDGQPAHGGANQVVLAGDLKRVINMLPTAGIEPIGIGICTEDPKLFYPNYVIVTDVNKLATTVVKKLASLLEEGYK